MTTVVSPLPQLHTRRAPGSHGHHSCVLGLHGIGHVRAASAAMQSLQLRSCPRGTSCLEAVPWCRATSLVVPKGPAVGALVEDPTIWCLVRAWHRAPRHAWPASLHTAGDRDDRTARFAQQPAHGVGHALPVGRPGREGCWPLAVLCQECSVGGRLPGCWAEHLVVPVGLAARAELADPAVGSHVGAWDLLAYLSHGPRLCGCPCRRSVSLAGPDKLLNPLGQARHGRRQLPFHIVDVLLQLPLRLADCLQCARAALLKPLLGLADGLLRAGHLLLQLSFRLFDLPTSLLECPFQRQGPRAVSPSSARGCQDLLRVCVNTED
mmetsp:Transcript_83500/g.253398  ORF Transcript_83500/g.253398 Transcript_83500/m.253398 type:complete len:322 (-) Transcript_83500:671-1636(-)